MPLIKQLLAAAVGSVIVMSSPVQAADPASAPHELIDVSHYAEAFAHYRAAAEKGDRNAQRTTGLMLLYGERLYGSQVRQDVDEAKKWLSRAAANGCETSAYMLRRLASLQRTRDNA